MPNKNSRAGHDPLRTCVICREKKSQKALLRFAVLEGKLVYDLQRALPVKGRYVCNDGICSEKIEIWLKRARKKGKLHER